MKKYRVIFWIGFTTLLLQILIYFICRLGGNFGGWSDAIANFNWSPELLIPAPLMMIVGTIGICSYHGKDREE